MAKGWPRQTIKIAGVSIFGVGVFLRQCAGVCQRLPAAWFVDDFPRFANAPPKNESFFKTITCKTHRKKAAKNLDAKDLRFVNTGEPENNNNNRN